MKINPSPSRIPLLMAFTIFTLFNVSCTKQGPQKILLLADIQYCDCPTAGTRHYAESLIKLDTIVNRVESKNIDWVIVLGDVIDRDFESFAPVQEKLRKFNAPVYWILGNHDFNITDSLKTRVVNFTHSKKGYYAKGFRKTRFLFLNGMYNSTMAWKEGDEEYQKASSTLKKLKSADAPNAYNWNGGLGEEQLTWITKELAMAKRKKQQVTILCHQPAVPGELHSLWDSDKLIQIIEEYGEPVTYYCGHNHAGGHYQIDNLEIINLKGLVEGSEISYKIIEN